MCCSLGCAASAMQLRCLAPRKQSLKNKASHAQLCACQACGPACSQGCIPPHARTPARQPASMPPRARLQPAMLMLMLGRCLTDGSLLLLAPGHQQAEALGQYVTTLAYLTGRPELQPQRDALASDLETQQAVVAVLLDHALPRFTAALERAGCGDSSSSWDDDEDAKEHKGGGSGSSSGQRSWRRNACAAPA